MLEKIRQFAMEKYAGDTDKAEAFVEGFVKEASTTFQHQFDGAGNLLRRTLTEAPGTSLGSVFQEGVSQALGKGIGGLAVGLGIHGLNAAFSGVHKDALRTQFLGALARAISTNRILREADKSKVEEYADTIFRFAPHVAGDANLLSSILANAIHGEGIDPMTIKTLGDLESRYIENRSAGEFSPKSYV